MVVEEYNERIERENAIKKADRQYMIAAAYAGAAWERSKRMPRLTEAIEQFFKEPAEKQTPEQMLALIEMMDKEG